MPTMSKLLACKCQRTETALPAAELADYLHAVPDWILSDKAITKSFTFKNYYETLSFINAIAYVIHAEDHHPSITLTHHHCHITFTTHSVNNGDGTTGGISVNDFICAAKIEAVVQQSFS